LLLFAGAIHIAGSVKARKASRYATSDWMEIEKQRGISVASSVMQMEYRDCIINLLDTPGHQDFSEDTYRVPTAVDAANGVESQTLRLLEVCRAQRTPLITFINKLDREVRDRSISWMRSSACWRCRWRPSLGRWAWASASAGSSICTGPREALQCPVTPTEEKIAGVVFKVQANMNLAHRDRIAFVRVCAGRFERSMRLKICRNGKDIRTGSAVSLSFAAARPAGGCLSGRHHPGALGRYPLPCFARTWRPSLQRAAGRCAVRAQVSSGIAHRADDARVQASPRAG